ncbi:MAG: FkbM family methyltransferase, partial [Desulfurococcaceae archaeon]
VNRMDKMIDRADVVKIDCEGGEIKVVRGMEGIIQKCYPILIIEHHEYRGANIYTVEPIKNFLESYGYITLTINECHRGYYHPSRPKEMLRPLLAHHIINKCFKNLSQGLKWYHGLPYNWWWGMSLLDFIYEIENHVIEEEEWLKLL